MENKPLITLVWTGEPSANRHGSGLGIDRHLLTDCRKLKKILNTHGYTATYTHIHDAWEEYSAEDMASGWLDVGYPEERTLKALLKYLKEPVHE